MQRQDIGRLLQGTIAHLVAHTARGGIRQQCGGQAGGRVGRRVGGRAGGGAHLAEATAAELVRGAIRSVQDIQLYSIQEARQM